jgi:apolipoprotein D and lipocalin family protein
MHGMLLMVVGSLSAAALVAGASLAGGAEPRTVDSVDLRRYSGTWHELARIPNRFQKDCVGGATAEYVLREDGKIDVINRCWKPGRQLKVARGLAKVEDSTTQSKLKVSFFSILGFRPVWGDYWILALGDSYEYAVVGSPDREYGWILCRSPKPAPQILAAAWEAVRRAGYNPGDFLATTHGQVSAAGSSVSSP